MSTKLSPGLRDLLAGIEKKHGQGAIMSFGAQPAHSVDVVSTGIAALDKALGVGGLTRGQPVEIYGPESSGKTTIALHLVAEAQKLGGVCAYVDVEHALDPVYAGVIGVDVDSLLLSQPGDAEEALDITKQLCESGEIAVIVVDSIAALVPRAELAGDIGDAHMGLQARLMSQTLRIIKGSSAQTKTIVFFVNQLRNKIGIVYGSPETTPGGRAMAFAAGVRMDIRRIEAIKDGTEIIGGRTRIKVVKNKWAPPYKTCEFDIIYGEGVSRTGSLLDAAVDAGVIKKSGAWFTYEGTQLGQGREKAKEALKDDALFAQIQGKLT